jgi:hypothetical protein
MVKLKNGWRRWTTPTTIKRKQDYFFRSPANNNSIKVTPDRDYIEPELDLERQQLRDKTRKEKVMGEAKEIVGSKKDKIIDLSKRRKAESFEDGTVLDRITSMIEDLDRAIEVKQHDLDVEGTAQAPENHFKLGILRASDSLLRRARAMLEDYGSDLVNDLDPTEDIEAAGGEEFETNDHCDHDFSTDDICNVCGLPEHDADQDGLIDGEDDPDDYDTFK